MTLTTFFVDCKEISEIWAHAKCVNLSREEKLGIKQLSNEMYGQVLLVKYAIHLYKFRQEKTNIKVLYDVENNLRQKRNK